jgi:hypothetical protein
VALAAGLAIYDRIPASPWISDDKNQQNREGNNAQKPKLARPTEADMPILRRAAAGYIVVTMVDGKPRYNYADGAYVSLQRHRNDGAHAHFTRLVSNGWLVPDKDTLFKDAPNA